MPKKILPLLIFSAVLLGCTSPSTTDNTPTLPPELAEPVYEAPTDPSAPPAGHSSHGEAFNKGPRQAARWMNGKTGNVSFPIKTDSEEAQKFFNQGIGQLHGFWTLEAERSFRQVLKLDPDNHIFYSNRAAAHMALEQCCKCIATAYVARKLRTMRISTSSLARFSR